MDKSVKRNRVENVQYIEPVLRAAMQPVAPRPAFVSGLKTRLVAASANKEANREVFGYVLLTMVGVAGGALFVATGLRAVASLAGMIGLIKLARDHAPQPRTPMMLR